MRRRETKPWRTLMKVSGRAFIEKRSSPKMATAATGRRSSQPPGVEHGRSCNALNAMEGGRAISLRQT
jgi:hypothetical protein